MHGDGGTAMSAAVDVRPALLGHLKDLHLPTVRECYEDTARRAERETLSYEQYLLEVITRECEQRRKSRVQRLLKDSELPLEKSLQNFDLKRLPAKAARQLRTLLDGSFLDRKENVLVFGNPGSGKSHLDGTVSGTGGGERTQDALHQMRATDAGFTGRQAGPAAEPGD